ncbi:MAG: RagB/SusD family nutrient uptake outer membrane protein [Paludibacteraceae bacterium]|nr:RagB/SusD family nutrient uptake outer membrane protein [Paludibacteraceae bacterium]
MKKLYKIFPALLLTLSLASCDDYLDVKPQGILDQETAYSEPDKVLNAAYAMLGNDWFEWPFNLWPYGDMTSDDCMMGGGGLGDTQYHSIEVFTVNASHGHLDALWYRLFFAISRCNRALDAIESATNLDPVRKEQMKAEALFLRAHFYYKLISVFYQVPWIGTEAAKNNMHETISNTEFTHEQLMLKVIDDFKFGYRHLPAKDPGMTTLAHKDAAAAYVAKCYLDIAYGDGYEATNYPNVEINKNYLDSVIAYTKDLVYSSHYGMLEDYGDVFLPEYRNSKESVFAVQHSLNNIDNTNVGRANWSNTLNGVWGIWSKGWDFHKPTQNLVNAFRLDNNGLPLDPAQGDYNEILRKGEITTYKYDPRLFHTVGMPTYPYKYEEEWTLQWTNSRTPSDFGFYCSMKEVTQRSKGDIWVEDTWQAFAQNDYVIRYAEVLLIAAEANIEKGETAEGIKLINLVRERANASVNKHIGYASAQVGSLATYGTLSQEEARKALRNERRLELAMEGHRFFDLRRWGMCSTTLNNFFKETPVYTYEALNDDNELEEHQQAYAEYYQREAFFNSGKNEYWPVPSNQMLYVPGLYTQNKGY